MFSISCLTCVLPINKPTKKAPYASDNPANDTTDAIKKHNANVTTGIKSGLGINLFVGMTIFSFRPKYLISYTTAITANTTLP